MNHPNPVHDPALKLGVLSDTHIPDRAPRLQAKIARVFEEAGIQAILHAGDISTPSVLAELRQVAPVYAVRGNRDLFQRGDLPATRCLNFNGVLVALTHGHFGWRGYLIDKIQFVRQGYRLERYQTRLLAAFPQARVIVFGHTHVAVNHWVNGQLLFNPGSPHFPLYPNKAPSLGILHIEPGGAIKSELVYLDRALTSQAQRWEDIPVESSAHT
jgi:uncharacterized protein